MPWIALHVGSHSRVDITQYDEPRAELVGGDYICQLCGETLYIKGAHQRQGGMVRAHFYYAHNCYARYDAHPESPEHLWAKTIWLKSCAKSISVCRKSSPSLSSRY
jgi:competence CoiA-like predicted nuclease